MGATTSSSSTTSTTFSCSRTGSPKPVIPGGEEDLANLVLRLAISQMIAERAGQPFSLLILDEIFGSLDELRRASVLELLRRLNDRFEQVILITHIESVREMLDHVITVRYDPSRDRTVVQHDGAPDGRLLPRRADADVLRRSGSRRLMAIARPLAAHRARMDPYAATARRSSPRSTTCSARRSRSAIAVTGSRACACRTSIRRSGDMRCGCERRRAALARRARRDRGVQRRALFGAEGWMGPLAVRPDPQGAAWARRS